MTPSPTPQTAVIVERLDGLSRQISELDEKIECLTKDQSRFMVDYTKAHTDLEHVVKAVDRKADEAHHRIDAITKIVWSIALPVILGALAFLWAVASHAVTIGTIP